MNAGSGKSGSRKAANVLSGSPHWDQRHVRKIMQPFKAVAESVLGNSRKSYTEGGGRKRKSADDPNHLWVDTYCAIKTDRINAVIVCLIRMEGELPTFRISVNKRPAGEYKAAELPAAMRLWQNLAASAVEDETIFADFDAKVVESRRLSRAERQARLANAPRKPQKIEVTSSAYVRNPDVVAEVLERANGICEEESCGKPAPFLRAKDGTPYLEVHHRICLADGGDDTVENAIALCPNCHRRGHFGL